MAVSLLFQALVILLCSFDGTGQEFDSPKISGYRPIIEGDDAGNTLRQTKYSSEGWFVLPALYNIDIVVFGENWPESNQTSCLRLVESSVSCVQAGSGDLFLNVELRRVVDDINCTGLEPRRCQDDLRRFTFAINSLELSSEARFYFCAPYNDYPYCNDSTQLVHQGNSPFVTIEIEAEGIIIPLAVQILGLGVLLCLSGLFSGLNLGLMSLDLTSLKIVMESGTKRQAWCARRIYPVRKHGNYLLCTILLGNVAVNSTISILIDSLTNGGNAAIAIAASTIGIVIFGEIIPQAICSRYGLYVGGFTIPITYVFLILTAPLALPLSLILNCILGQEIGAIYNRDELLELLRITAGRTDMAKDEVNIIFGALRLKEKTVGDVMTKMANVFCLNIDSTLDIETIKEIYESGHSRIPIFEGDKNQIVGILYTRNLAFIDPEDEMSLRQYHSFYYHKPLEVWDFTKLDDMLESFMEERKHIAIVKNVFDKGPDKDPVYEVIGIVTLEDIIEEILQREIIDETDRYVNNEMLETVPSKGNPNLIRDIIGNSASNACLTGPQKLALFQVLSSSVDPFTEEHMSPVVLKRLLQKESLSKEVDNIREEAFILYESGRPANFFAIIVEGKAEVKIGSQKMTFECRSFNHFGEQALMNVVDAFYKPESFVPDFTLKLFPPCLVFTVTQKQYALAYRASQYRSGKIPMSSAKGNGVVVSEDEDEEDVAEMTFSQEWQRLEESEENENPEVSGLVTLAKLKKRKKKKKGSTLPSPKSPASGTTFPVLPDSSAQDDSHAHIPLLTSSLPSQVSYSAMDKRESVV
jgi:metal transporter CNNM